MIWQMCIEKVKAIELPVQQSNYTLHVSPWISECGGLSSERTWKTY